MSLRGRLMRATAAFTLAFQAMVTTFAAVSVCLDRPHTHGGTGAPDCAMHHQRPAAADASNHHEHHAGTHHNAKPETTSIACRCSSDPLSFLVSDMGIAGEPMSVRRPTLYASQIALSRPSTIDLRIPPPAPPPRSTFS